MPPNNAPWTEEHDTALLRAIIGTALASRRTLYTTPGLEAVSGNGGSRINQRLQFMLRRMAGALGRDAGVVEAEVRVGGRGARGRARTANGKWKREAGDGAGEGGVKREGEGGRGKGKKRAREDGSDGQDQRGAHEAAERVRKWTTEVEDVFYFDDAGPSAPKPGPLARYPSSAAAVSASAASSLMKPSKTRGYLSIMSDDSSEDDVQALLAPRKRPFAIPYPSRKEIKYEEVEDSE